MLIETAGTPDNTVGREVAMHISFAKPKFLKDSEVSPEILQKEREIVTAQTAQDPKMAGKPEAAIKSAVEGRMKKYLGEVVLLSQPYIREEKKTVGQLIAETPGASVTRFERFEIGAAASGSVA